MSPNPAIWVAHHNASCYAADAATSPPLQKDQIVRPNFATRAHCFRMRVRGCEVSRGRHFPLGVGNLAMLQENGHSTSVWSSERFLSG